MRNSIQVKGLIVTIDNAGCIGEKPADVVQVPNEVSGYFTARTAILEQWCAGAKPIQLLLANFSGDAAWDGYVRGMTKLFHEIGEEMPPITGSSESNFDALQSAMSLTMIGEPSFNTSTEGCHYFLIGEPLVGDQVVANPNKVAQLKEIYAGIKGGWIAAVWPTGSKGIGQEITRFIGEGYTCDIDAACTAGPSTAVLVAVKEEHVQTLSKHMTAPVREIIKAI